VTDGFTHGEAAYAAAGEADRLIAQGNALEDSGEFEAALERYREALRVAPEYPRAHLNAGNALRHLGRHDEAASALRQSLRCSPSYAPAHFNLGTLLAELGENGAAESELREALRLQPDLADAAVVLADIFESTGRLPDAEAELQHALHLRPDFAGAALNLGQLLLRQNRFDDAETSLLKARAMDPSLASVHGALGSLYVRTGRGAEAERAFAIALELDSELESSKSAYLFSLNLRNDLDASAIFEEHARLGAVITRAARGSFTTWNNRPDPERRIKVGYVSGDLGQHPIGLFLRPVLDRHDRKCFDVHCYSNRASVDDVTRLLQQSVEHWHSIAGIEDRLVADLIRRDEIDLLIDLSGHTDRNRLAVFARHPAPVQITWLGYLNTTGLPAMNYRICDRHTDPEGAAEHLHTERLYRMPHSQWCYAPVYELTLNLRPHAERPNAIVFGSFNQYAKISDSCLDLWCSLLRAAPEASLVVLDVPPGKTQDAFRRRLLQRNINRDRVSVRGRLGISEYFAAIANVDIALDTFPYNGATTTLDTLWMGVPLVALHGDRSIARSGYSLLQSIDAPELIASGPREYVDLNLRLVRDTSWRNTLRATLRNRLAASPLMDSVRFAADLEAGYRHMWRAWCASQRGVRPDS
jgi:predicted O-linked N-acetylglucosamine transferase (SPINDLY family)